MPDTYTLAVAQPKTAPAERREDNVARAVALVAEAASHGADLVLFPEHSPGPFTESESYDAEPALAEAARAHGPNVCWSRMERCADGHFRLTVYVLDRMGARAFRYERSHPATVPPKDTGGWVAPGPALGSFELDGIPMGIVVCSELWIPEPARVLSIPGLLRARRPELYGELAEPREGLFAYHTPPRAGEPREAAL